MDHRARHPRLVHGITLLAMALMMSARDPAVAELLVAIAATHRRMDSRFRRAYTLSRRMRASRLLPSLDARRPEPGEVSQLRSLALSEAEGRS